MADFVNGDTEAAKSLYVKDNPLLFIYKGTHYTGLYQDIDDKGNILINNVCLVSSPTEPLDDLAINHSYKTSEISLKQRDIPRYGSWNLGKAITRNNPRVVGSQDTAGSADEERGAEVIQLYGPRAKKPPSPPSRTSSRTSSGYAGRAGGRRSKKSKKSKRSHKRRKSVRK